MKNQYVLFSFPGLASPGVNVGESAASTARAARNAPNASFFPSGGASGESSRSTIRPERFSDPTNFCYQSYNQSNGVNSGGLKGNNMGELVNNFQTIDQRKKDTKSDVKSSEALQAFDPLVLSKSVETLTDAELNVNVNTSIGGSTQTLVPESMALSPDQGFASPGAHSDHGHFETSSSGVSRDSGLPSESTSLDTISEDVGLKLTEQQNIHIDGHRLSTAALTLFDPLMQESSTDPEESDAVPGGVRDMSDQASKVQSRQSYNEQGARPKSSGAPASTPKISVQPSDSESGNKPAASMFDSPSGRRDASGRSVPDQDTVKIVEGDNATVNTAHRGSTDSSSSSLVDISTPKKGEVNITL